MTNYSEQYIERTTVKMANRVFCESFKVFSSIFKQNTVQTINNKTPVSLAAHYAYTSG